MNNIINFDLLQLVGGSNWEQQEQTNFINKYVIALLGFINENLTGKIKPEIEEQFAQIVRKTPYSEDKIHTFFQNNYPDLDQEITDLVAEFKKQFVIKVYQEKIRELNNKTSDKLLTKWRQILNCALGEDWEAVVGLMKS